MQPDAPYQPPSQPQPPLYGPPAPQGPPQPTYNPYEFITSPQPTGRKPLFGGNPLKQRLLIIAGGALALIILIVIATSLISGGKGNTAAFISIAQQQNELVRLAKVGADQATRRHTQNFAITAQLSLQSDQRAWVGYLAKHGTKIGDKQLAATKSAEADSQLNDAKQASGFDSVFTELMNTRLNEYQKQLRRAFADTSNPATRQLLSSNYADAQLLSAQLNKAN